MRIVFFGTPDFAAACLKKLVDCGHDIAAVVTQPDKPVGRKMKLTPSAVKSFAVANNIPALTPDTLKNGAMNDILREYKADIFVVVAYGKLLPQSLLDMPKFGAVNVHASLLPKFRGASPVQSAILAGESETGVTIMRLDAGMDTGDIITQKTVRIYDSDNSESLFERLADEGAHLLCETLGLICDGRAEYKKQNDGTATYTTMITKEMGRIDFNKNAQDIFNLVRAFDPWPSAFTVIGGKRVKISRVSVLSASGRPGEIIQSDGRLVIACGENTAVEILTLTPEGKKPMSAAEYTNGNKISRGSLIGE